MAKMGKKAQKGQKAQKAPKTIQTDMHGGWASQGYGRYRGDGWYRIRLAVPGTVARARRFLYFGAADEESWIYVDGKLAFEHSRRTTGLGFSELWTRPFFFECGKVLTPGREHTIAVKVFNNWGSGGLYKPIHLIGSDTPLSPEQLWKIVREHEQKNKTNE